MAVGSSSTSSTTNVTQTTELATTQRFAGRRLRDLLDEARAIETTDLVAAREIAQAVRALARTADQPAFEAEALYRLASIAFSNNDPTQAFAIALDASVMAGAAGAPVVEAWSLNLMSIVQNGGGNYIDALAHALRAVEIYRGTGEVEDEGNMLNSIAAIHHSLGDFGKALATYEAARLANKGTGRFDKEAITLANMSEVRLLRNEGYVALGLAGQALDLSRRHAPGFLPEILARVAEAHVSLLEFDQAASCIAEGRGILAARAAESGESAGVEEVLALAVAQGKVDMGRGDLVAAKETFTDALAIALQPASGKQPDQAAQPEVAMHLHAELCQVCKREGRFEEALAHQEARFALHAELFDAARDLRLKTLQATHDLHAEQHQRQILALRTGELEAMVRGRTIDLEEYQLEAFQRLAALAEFRDTDTGERTIRVGDLSADIAIELGEPEEWAQHLRLAGRLHDIGKVSVPDSILLKPGPLTPHEVEVMTAHATIGAEILGGSNSPLIQLAATVALTHHERWDGTGYPQGLRGDDIPLGGRVVTVADVFDALISDRAYKHAWTVHEAIVFIRSGGGSQFDTRIVDAFLRVMARRHPAVIAGLPPVTEPGTDHG